MNNIITFFRESMVARALIPLGIILIIFGVVVFNVNSKNQDYIKIESVVSKIELYEDAHTDIDGNYVDATYTVFVTYTVDGKEYNEELGVLSGYKQGDKVTIYYNPNNPSEITQTKSLILPIIIILGGIIALVSGIVSAFKTLKKYKKMNVQEKGWANGN